MGGCMPSDDAADGGGDPDRLAGRAGLNRLATAVGDPNGGAYRFPLSGPSSGVPSGISYARFGRETYASPALLAVPMG